MIKVVWCILIHATEVKADIYRQDKGLDKLYNMTFVPISHVGVDQFSWISFIFALF